MSQRINLPQLSEGIHQLGRGFGSREGWRVLMGVEGEDLSVTGCLWTAVQFTMLLVNVWVLTRENK